MDERTPIPAARKIITHKRSVNRYAAAAGVINIATTKTMPIVCKEATVTIVNKVIRK